MSRHLNLLPWKVRCRALWRERLRQWCFLWGIVAVATFSASCWEWQRFASSQQELETWQRRSEGIQSIESTNGELQEKIRILQARLTKYGHFENERNGFHLLATVSQSAGLTNGKLQVQKLTFKTMHVADAAATPAPNAKPGPPKMRTVHVLSLSGVAATNLTLAQFVSSLRDSAAFETVELKSSQQGKGEIASGPRAYQVECSF